MSNEIIDDTSNTSENITPIWLAMEQAAPCNVNKNGQPY